MSVPPAFNALKQYKQFILYRTAPSTTRPGKTDKFPIDWRTGQVANAHDPAIWLDAQTAELMVTDGHGIGFVFTENDPFWFMDIDDCLQEDDQWSPTAQQICSLLQGTAVEVSQSGRGLHVIRACGADDIKQLYTGNGSKKYVF